MSLIRPIIRMCAIGALRGNTWAGARVFDSDNTPLIDALSTDAQPYITVYTDEDNRLDISGMDIYGSNRSLSLVLEIGLATAVVVGTGGAQIRIPATDEGMEAAIDILESQAMSALFGDPLNPWAEILRRIVMRIYRILSPRGGSAERGTRWAARRLVFVCDVISDPAPGTVLPEHHPVRAFIELASGSSPMAAAASLITKLLNTTEAPDWRVAQAWLGLTEAGIRSTGLAPFGVPDETAADLLVVSPEQEEWQESVPSPDDDEFD